MSEETDLIQAYERALSDYLYAHWPFRHTERYDVDVQAVDDEADVDATGYLGRDNHDEPRSFAEMKISTTALRTVGIEGLVTAERVILHARRLALWPEQEYRAVWVEQSRGYSLKTVSGFYIRGHFVATDDKAKAYSIVKDRELKIAA